jgi:hypothetical protein
MFDDAQANLHTGTWEVRSAYMIGDQKVVSEGQIVMAGEEVSMEGKIYELT